MTNVMTQIYPALMGYILDRNKLTTTTAWCDQLTKDQADARNGGFADVYADLALAQADYAAQARAARHSEFPYNSAMGEFLGLPLGAGGEPAHGYYMACCVMRHHRLGVAARELERLIGEGAELKITVARSKATGKPVRFQRFRGPTQIAVWGQSVVLQNGKVKITLSSNWSAETCLEQAVAAMRGGFPYGAPREAVEHDEPLLRDIAA